MNYPEFETSFETRFQTHTDSYPHAVEYHRARFTQTIQYLLSSILEQTDTLIQQSETSWAHTEEIIGDILYCGEITVEQLFALEIPNQLTADKEINRYEKESSRENPRIRQVRRRQSGSQISTDARGGDGQRATRTSCCRTNSPSRGDMQRTK